MTEEKEMGSNSNEKMDQASTPERFGKEFSQDRPEGSYSNLVFVAQLTGTVDSKLLQEVISETVRRHETLQTRFHATADGVELIVDANFTPEMETVALKGGFGVEEEIRKLLQEGGQRSLYQEQKSPYHFALATDGRGRHALLLIAHPDWLDKWAIRLVFEEIFTRYEAVVMGQPLDFPAAPGLHVFTDYQQRMRLSGRLERQAKFWREVIGERKAASDLPLGAMQAEERSLASVKLAFTTEELQMEAIRQAAAAYGVPPFTFLLAVYGLLLAKSTEQQNLWICIPVAGRSTPDLLELVGFCANEVPVLLEVDEELTVVEYVKRVQRSMGRSLNHADLPFAELVHTLGINHSEAYGTLFTFAFETYGRWIEHQHRIGDLLVCVEDGRVESSPFGLTLSLSSTDPVFGGEFQYQPSLFAEEEVHALLQSLLNYVDEFASNPHKRLKEVGLS